MDALKPAGRPRGFELSLACKTATRAHHDVTPQEIAPAMAQNPNLAVIERFVGAVFSGDGETLKGLCAPDFQLHEGSGLAFAGTYHGGEGFLQFLEAFGATFEIEQLEPLRTYVTEDPDFAVTEMDLRATVKATGKVFASSLLERWRFRDGRVVEITPHYFNAM